ncbi:MAG: hypothetical protein AB1760_00120 [Pseudomonadota bacterium]
MSVTETQAIAKYDPFTIMDKLDDQLIADELQGRLAKVLAYSFQQDGKKVTGLSKAGVDAVSREMAKQGEVIREIELDWQDLGSEVLFKAKVGRYALRVDAETGKTIEVLMDTVFGVKRQPKTYPKGGINQWWFEQGSMKAIRNGKMRLIREDLKQQIIAIAEKSQQIVDVDAEARRVGYDETPKPAPAKPTAAPVTGAQRKEMADLARQANLAPADVQAMMAEQFGVRDSKALTYEQAAKFLDYLRAVAGKSEAAATAQTATAEQEDLLGAFDKATQAK